MYWINGLKPGLDSGQKTKEVMYPNLGEVCSKTFDIWIDILESESTEEQNGESSTPNPISVLLVPQVRLSP